MKRLIYILFVLVLACNGESVSDCFQSSGAMIQETIEVPNFERILVNRNVELIIKEAPQYKVTVETGENLINDVKVSVIGDQLILTDTNTCNFVRDFGITKVYVEAPDLKEIRTSSQYVVTSDGILNFETLQLLSEDFNGGSEFTVGDFRLSVASENLRITSNNISIFYIDGEVNDLFVGFFSGSGRFEGAELVAQNINVSHRSSNDMVLNPIQSITGVIRGTGDVILVNEPTIIDVEEIYTGRLKFQ